MASVQKHFLRVACMAVAACMAQDAASRADVRARQDGRPHLAHELVIGLVCGPTTPTSHLHETWRDWDSRFSGGRADKQCLDENARVTIVPLKASAEFQRTTGNTFVVIQMTAANGEAVERLFSSALEGAKNGSVRGNMVLLDGKVIVSSFVAGPFSGRTFDFSMSSPEYASRVAALLSTDVGK